MREKIPQSKSERERLITKKLDANKFFLNNLNISYLNCVNEYEDDVKYCWSSLHDICLFSLFLLNKSYETVSSMQKLRTQRF